MRVANLRSLLKNRNYAIYTVGNGVSLTGTWIYGIAFAWLVWQLTESTLWLGIVAAAGIVPTILAGLIGGVLADRLDRLKLVIWTQILAFLATGLLFILYQFDAVGIYWLILFKIIISTTVAISQPARMALIPNLVGEKMVGPAISFGSMVFNTARFIGPAIAGFIIARGGVGIAFLINALTYIVMAGAILMVKIPDRLVRSPTSGSKPNKMSRDMQDSLTYIRNHSGVLTLFVLMIFAVLGLRPISNFLPAISTGIFDRGVDGLAILTSSAAGGSIIGGIWSAGRDIDGLTKSALVTVSIYAILIIIFLMMPWFWMGCIVFAATGFFTTIFAISAQTLVQASVADDMRGRVMSLWFILTRGGPDAGALFIGIVGEAAGLPTAFTIGAIICVAIAGWAWLRRKDLANELEDRTQHIDSRVTNRPSI